ncbi:AAA family ATPase [Faecalibacterium duncaniae]|jgi:AAA15 family ATPase/GTPase|uniref:AAA family ATPase n=1 Tax=Faecalibacterium prausnitzii TaxID=853 RepID=UPI001CBEFB4D|nr:ATP-binding protein [Faecalibacterium prausnitzii]
MRIKRVELNDFKRFTHLTVEDIPETAKLIVLVGPNGSGKTSFMEALNHYYKFAGYGDVGESNYLSKIDVKRKFEFGEWYSLASKTVDIDFYDAAYPKDVGRSNIKGHFYFRSAYRNEPDFVIDTMRKQDDPTKTVHLKSLIQNDQSVSSNYQRLIANSISELYKSENNQKDVATLRSELTGKISASIERVFEDLHFSSLGDPLQNGNFYFTKGTTKDFPYKNLSAGEKSAFDLILDLVVQSKYYPDAVYCIDEPETHMHTKLQGKVLRELYGLIPGNSQLWLSTHSIGMLQEAQDIEKEAPGTVVFLDFDGRDFDDDQIIRPSKIGRAVMDKFYELAFGDFSKLLLPQKIVFCEGDSCGTTRKSFDSSIYSTIFENTHPEAYFLSGGSCEEIINKLDANLGEVLKVLLKETKIIKVIDRDDRSNQEVDELKSNRISVLSKRNLESYLLDDSVIEKLCISVGKSDKVDECLQKKQEALSSSIKRENAPDDLKSARGDIYTSLKKILGLTQCGNRPDPFLRDTMAPLITPDMEIYKQLERDIFGDN